MASVKGEVQSFGVESSSGDTVSSLEDRLQCYKKTTEE